MKKIHITIMILLAMTAIALPFSVDAITTVRFDSNQLAASASNGYILTSDGTWNVWANPATIITGTDLDDAYNNSPSGNKFITIDDGDLLLNNAGDDTVVSVVETDGIASIHYNTSGEDTLGHVWYGQDGFDASDVVFAIVDAGVQKGVDINDVANIGLGITVGGASEGYVRFEDGDGEAIIMLARDVATVVDFDIDVLGALTDGYLLGVNDLGGDDWELTIVDPSTLGGDINTNNYGFTAPAWPDSSETDLAAGAVVYWPLTISGTITNVSVYLQTWNLTDAVDTIAIKVYYGGPGALASFTWNLTRDGGASNALECHVEGSPPAVVGCASPQVMKVTIEQTLNGGADSVSNLSVIVEVSET